MTSAWVFKIHAFIFFIIKALTRWKFYGRVCGITNVEEPVNELEEKRVKESNKFAKTLIKFAASNTVSVISGSMLPQTIKLANDINNPIFGSIAAAVLSGMMVSSIYLNSHLAQDLVNSYDERETKEDEAEVDDNDSKEKTKCLKK